MPHFTKSLSILGAVLYSGLLFADDWPRFRGIMGDGRSTETGLLTEWPEGGPQLLWTVDGLGKGYSSVSILGDLLFTIGDLDGKQLVFAVSLKTKSIIWKQEIGEANSGSFVGSRSTPTIDGDSLHCLSTNGKLACLNANTGEVVWQNDLVENYDAAMMLAKGKWEWKFSESPLVDGDQVVVTPGTKDAALVAFDKMTGEEIWRTSVPNLGEQGVDGAGYSSIVISKACGVKQYVQLFGRGLIGVNAKSGEFLWSYNRVANDVANISTPVIDGDFVFSSTGYQTGSALLQLSKSESGKFSVDERYFLNHRKFQNHHGGFILHDGYIFGGHGHGMGLPICVRISDGKIMWGPKRNRGKDSAACCYADGHIYFRYQDGLIVLVEATPDRYHEKCSFKIPDVQAESWSHPVISNGFLYLKEQDRLLCYDIRAKQE